jgi:hypothetical protein
VKTFCTRALRNPWQQAGQEKLTIRLIDLIIFDRQIVWPFDVA